MGSASGTGIGQISQTSGMKCLGRNRAWCGRREIMMVPSVLLRRPLLSSRCSRWHRVPRRVDGATCHAIDAMSHAVMEWSLNGGRVTMMTMFDGTSRAPGDFGWDPMGLMSPANEERMKMRELQHGRLAMIAIGGMIHGSFVTGTGVFGGMN